METHKDRQQQQESTNTHPTPMSKAQIRLVKEAVRGKPEAINKVIGHYYKDILYFAAKKVGLQEAEDVAQQAITKIINRLGTLKEPSKVKSWMMKIVHDSCVDYMRRNTLEHKLFVSMEAEGKLGIEAEHDTSEFLPEEALENAEMRAHIIASIDSLPANYADALRLYYLEELSYDEIAQVLNIDRRKVKNDLYNARILFKKHFEESTGTQTRFQIAPVLAVPILTQVLQTDCNQLITPDIIDRTAAFTSAAVASKFGYGATASAAGTKTGGLSVGKVVAIAAAAAAVTGVSVAIIIGANNAQINNSANPTNATQQANTQASTSSNPPANPSAQHIETLADMIGANEAQNLETMASLGTNEASCQAFMHAIGANFYNSSNDYDYQYVLYLIEKQDKQLIIATRAQAQSTHIDLRYQFRQKEDPPRMAKVALMFD